MPALQQGELLGVAPLQHAEQVAAELAQPLHEVLRPPEHEGEAVVRDRHRRAGRGRCATSSPDATAATSAAGSIGGSNSGSGRPTPRMSSDCRILRSRSSTRRPVVAQLRVLRDDEVRAVRRRRRAGVRAPPTPVDGRAQEHVVLARLVPELPVVLGVAQRPRTQLPRPLPQQVVGEQVEHPRLVDALRGVLAEQHVAPVEQVVDVGHHHGAAVGAGAHRRDRVRVERVVEVPAHRGLEPAHHEVVAALQPRDDRLGLLEARQRRLHGRGERVRAAGSPRCGSRRPSGPRRGAAGRGAARPPRRRGPRAPARTPGRACRPVSSSVTSFVAGAGADVPPSTPNASVQAPTSAPTSTARNGRNRQLSRARVGSKTYSYHCFASANRCASLKRLRDEQRRVEEGLPVVDAVGAVEVEVRADRQVRVVDAVPLDLDDRRRRPALVERRGLVRLLRGRREHRRDSPGEQALVERDGGAGGQPDDLVPGARDLVRQRERDAGRRGGGVTDVALAAEQVQRGRGRPGGVQPASGSGTAGCPSCPGSASAPRPCRAPRSRRGGRSGRRRRRGSARRSRRARPRRRSTPGGSRGRRSRGPTRRRACSGRTSCRSPGTAARRGRRPRRCRAARRTVLSPGRRSGRSPSTRPASACRSWRCCRCCRWTWRRRT